MTELHFNYFHVHCHTSLQSGHDITTTNSIKLENVAKANVTAASMTSIPKRSLCCKPVGSASKIKVWSLWNIYGWDSLLKINTSTAGNSQVLKSHHSILTILFPVHSLNLLLSLNNPATILLWEKKKFFVIRSLRTDNIWPRSSSINWQIQT